MKNTAFFIVTCALSLSNYFMNVNINELNERLNVNNNLFESQLLEMKTEVRKLNRRLNIYNNLFESQLMKPLAKDTIIQLNTLDSTTDEFNSTTEKLF